MVQTEEKLAGVRRGVPATEQLAFLNAGSYGPLTAAAGEAIVRLAQEEVREGRQGARAFRRNRELKDAVRAGFARILGCGASEVGLTTSTTGGMNIACWGLKWSAGDEVVTTDIEHMGGLAPLYILEHRIGIRLRFVDSHGRGEQVGKAVEDAINERTRAVIVSHVSWSAGVVLPLKQIAAAAHRAGAVVIVDGAQSGGAIPLDMKELGVDAYAVPGQKWLCGPEGIGAVYISGERMAEILPSHVGGGAFGPHDELGHYTVGEEAGRFNTPGNPYAPALAGMNASLKWFLDDVGPDWAYPRIPENAARCRALLEGIEGVDVITPPGRHAGLVHFTIAGWDPTAAEQELLKRRVLVRSMQRPSCVRASTGFYNNEEDLQALAEGVKEVLKLAPHPAVT
ncbi:MAG TPA: aminotransferase class V-fold PLP-dependent enzyme [Steroidobacteraceae bacterium]|nr:aminotransferase class V-fold PLP-dependent enzyme [Steroidobacteraceae bacterium]